MPLHPEAVVTPAEQTCFDVIRSLRRIEQDLRESLPLAHGTNTGINYARTLAVCSDNIQIMKEALCQLKQSQRS